LLQESEAELLQSWAVMLPLISTHPAGTATRGINADPQLPTATLGMAIPICLPLSLESSNMMAPKRSLCIFHFPYPGTGCRSRQPLFRATAWACTVICRKWLEFSCCYWNIT